MKYGIKIVHAWYANLLFSENFFNTRVSCLNEFICGFFLQITCVYSEDKNNI